MVNGVSTYERSFNPRAHAGRDVSTKTRCNPRQIVSIHAPMQGATLKCSPKTSTAILVSIHAPMQGATSLFWCSHRPPEVSIHAPMQGATSRPVLHLPVSIVSIHAPMQGATKSHNAPNVTKVFQSTRPCRARHWTIFRI